MKKWYNKYIQVYDKEFAEVESKIKEEVYKVLAEKQSNTPVVSVVLIAHNEEKHLLSCIWSLIDNKCNLPIEIIAVNNNSTDRTENVLKELGVKYFNEAQKGPGHARQCGLNHAKGKFHICIDADTIYPPHFIHTHLKYLTKPNVICTFGLWSFMPDEKYSVFGLWMYETLRDLHLRIQALKRPELCVRGMNFAFNTELARRFGFRTDIRRGEDGSLALAMKSYGKVLFLTTRKVRVLTGNGTLNADQSLINSFKIRIIKALKGFGGLFSKKKEYKDEDSNLLK